MTKEKRLQLTLEHCAEMDALPIEERRKAMPAIEGTTASEETEKNLALWVT